MTPSPIPWIQARVPAGGGIAAAVAVAAIPLGVIFVGLAVLRLRACYAAALALIVALIVAVAVWGMPARLAGLAALQGAAFGVFPVFYIVLGALFLYAINVESGQFEIIRASLARVSVDRRIQALLIAFCFGAFLEGAAGGGTPVAIAGAMLVGLGFNSFQAAVVCLIANTAPVAFGSIGIPIAAMGGVMGLDEPGLLRLSAMVGRQLLLVSLIVPLYLVLVMAGLRRALEVLPAILVCGVTFAVGQWAVASYIGPSLPDILAALAAMGALLLLLRFWRPKTVFRFTDDPPPSEPRAPFGMTQIARACVPYIALTLTALLWGLPPVKRVLERGTIVLPVPGLDNAIARSAAGAVDRLLPIPARFKLDLPAAAGTAIFTAAIISALSCGFGPRHLSGLLRRTLRTMRLPAFTIMSIMALAYVMNASGMTGILSLCATRTGRLFPLVSPVLGWLGAFLTGSDTSSNVLFGALQKSAAGSLGIDPILTAAANTSGGGMGKMVSLQSLAIACAATGMRNGDARLLRFTLRHTFFFLALVCLIVWLQAHAAAG